MKSKTNSSVDIGNRERGIAGFGVSVILFSSKRSV